MSLNSFPTEEGLEIARAQVTQAEAAGIPPTVDMNPILLKPTTKRKFQVVVKGKIVGNMNVKEYYKYKASLLGVVEECFYRLSRNFDIVVIEGAGSPAEVNLREWDIANMGIAELADSSVILVGDIEVGGVFAWIVGTFELLTQGERKRIKGIVINKFRGEADLLKPGLLFLEKRLKRPVVGVIPYIEDLRLPEEDSIGLEKKNRLPLEQRVMIEILCLPHISNYTDFDPLENEPDVGVRYIKMGEGIGPSDCIIIPGTKNTIEDLLYIRRGGYIDAILNKRSGRVVVGICGGYQMLGLEVKDPYGVEGQRKRVEGLSLLPIITTLEKNKITHQVEAEDLLFRSGMVKGYKIHKGSSRCIEPVRAAFKIKKCSGSSVNGEDGAFLDGGRIWGTYIHGLFENDGFRREFITSLKRLRSFSLTYEMESFMESKEKEYERIAQVVRENIDMEKIYKILS
jgi:adenosylcobyric acid synthase